MESFNNTYIVVRINKMNPIISIEISTRWHGSGNGFGVNHHSTRQKVFDIFCLTEMYTNQCMPPLCLEIFFKKIISLRENYKWSCLIRDRTWTLSIELPISKISSIYTMIMIVKIKLNRTNNDEFDWILIKPNTCKEVFNF